VLDAVAGGDWKGGVYLGEAWAAAVEVESSGPSLPPRLASLGSADVQYCGSLPSARVDADRHVGAPGRREVRLAGLRLHRDKCPLPFLVSSSLFFSCVLLPVADVQYCGSLPSARLPGRVAGAAAGRSAEAGVHPWSLRCGPCLGRARLSSSDWCWVRWGVETGKGGCIWGRPGLRLWKWSRQGHHCPRDSQGRPSPPAPRGFSLTLPVPHRNSSRAAHGAAGVQYCGSLPSARRGGRTVLRLASLGSR
jgi:hypothetical protein